MPIIKSVDKIFYGTVNGKTNGSFEPSWLHPYDRYNSSCVVCGASGPREEWYIRCTSSDNGSVGYGFCMEHANPHILSRVMVGLDEHIFILLLKEIAANQSMVPVEQMIDTVKSKVDGICLKESSNGYVIARSRYEHHMLITRMELYVLYCSCSIYDSMDYNGLMMNIHSKDRMHFEYTKF